MSQLDIALDRLGEAVRKLSATTALAEGSGAALAEAEETIARLSAECETLRVENAALRSQHEEDTRLRAEAAQAVKVALRDLRELVPAAASGTGGAANG